MSLGAGNAQREFDSEIVAATNRTRAMRVGGGTVVQRVLLVPRDKEASFAASPGQPEPRAAGRLLESAMGTQLAYLVILMHISASFRGLFLSALRFRQVTGFATRKKASLNPWASKPQR